MFSHLRIKHLFHVVFLQLGKEVPTKIAKLVMYSLLLLLAWTLGRLVWVWVVPPTGSMASIHVTQISSGRNEPIYHIEQIAKNHFFGRFSEKNTYIEKKQEYIIDAPRTHLNLTLVGLVTSSVPEHGLAVIANNGIQSTYGIGESIEGTSVLLLQVLNDHVILRNKGFNEVLILAGINHNDLIKPIRIQVGSAQKTRIS
ncbi:type II secretion system protein N [Candidatus Enterovibrio escicola]|uniref:General secretion pathway protein C n=2 Tax=Candidatus Enterovibrio escicola TaxID=1927127 RepID=A0A2A5SYZ5_9GAMM|nr:type II secretion system protein N [Candidatus Enterovibrio escacola]PCS21133.1 General secretion pathway protein C [Candidatus Enterovibrio escacola]